MFMWHVHVIIIKSYHADTPWGKHCVWFETTHPEAAFQNKDPMQKTVNVKVAGNARGCRLSAHSIQPPLSLMGLYALPSFQRAWPKRLRRVIKTTSFLFFCSFPFSSDMRVVSRLCQWIAPRTVLFLAERSALTFIRERKKHIVWNLLIQIQTASASHFKD